MAPDASFPVDPGTSLPAHTLDAVRDALRRQLAAPAPEAGLRPALRELSREARERGILPEHVIVLLKDVWHSVPQQASTLSPAERAQILERAVTLCIEAYFDEDEPRDV